MLPWSHRAERRKVEEIAGLAGPQPTPSVAKGVKHHIAISCGSLQIEAKLHSGEGIHSLGASSEESLPLDTGAFLYVPSSFTLLAFLLPRRTVLLRGARVCELGAGLGMVSSILQQLPREDAPSEILATDGSLTTVRMLQKNLESNKAHLLPADPPLWEGSELRARASALLWGEWPNELSGHFDLVIAADVIFHAAPPQSTSRLGLTDETKKMILDLFVTAAALLARPSADIKNGTSTTSSQPACFVVAVEPRDKLVPMQPLHTAMMKAAYEMRMHCVERTERALDGRTWPDWHTNLYVWRLMDDHTARHPTLERMNMQYTMSNAEGTRIPLDLGILGVDDRDHHKNKLTHPMAGVSR